MGSSGLESPSRSVATVAGMGAAMDRDETPVEAPLIDFRHLLEKVGIDPQETLVMRHVPDERALRERLPWLAAEEPEIFNAYQSTHRKQVERSLTARNYLASFIADTDGKDRALFVGLFAVRGAHPISEAEFYAKSENRKLRDLGSRGLETSRQHLWFRLEPLPHMRSWKGKLVVRWSTGRAYARIPHEGKFEVVAIHDESRLHADRPDPMNLTLEHWQLGSLPPSWKQALREWRGIYLIFDRASKKGYVGAAYGDENVLGRWQEYYRTGHGGNRQLRPLDARHFMYSIIQLLAPDTPTQQVLDLETSWKKRLHTLEFGLNDN